MRSEVAADGVDVGVAYLNTVDTEKARWALSHPRMRHLLGERSVRPAPVDGGAAALVEAVEKRSRTVTYPWRGPIGLYASPVVQRNG